MPPGAVVVKDSFSVNADGRVFPGPMAVMEKMAPGFNPPSGDWRYTSIMPDGSVLGRTKGQDSDKMTFCVECHAQVAHQDHLHFPPQEYRITQDAAVR